MTTSEVLNMEWFQRLCAEVQAVRARLMKHEDLHAPALEREKSELDEQIKGWSQSLGNPGLPAKLRQHIEGNFDAALERIAEIDLAIESRAADARQLDEIVDPSAVAESLTRLAEVFKHSNASLGNIELAHHIDKIECFSDGKVCIRHCRLGALAGSVQLLADPRTAQVDTSSKEAGEKAGRITPRWLTRRRIDSADRSVGLAKSRAVWATDPERFAGLDDRWFDEQIVCVPKRKAWVEEYAPEVGALRKKGLTEEKLASHFGKSLVTIRKSLRIAKLSDAELRDLPRRMPQARWHVDNALEVARLAKTMRTNELVRHFGKSDTTIRKAIRHAETTKIETVAAAEALPMD